MQSLPITMTGIAPLLMHSARLVDPLDPIVREMKKISAKKTKKTDDDIARLAELEYMGGLWTADGQRPAVPTMALEACFREGARATRRGKDAERGAWVEGDHVDLIYDGPKTAAQLWVQRKRFALTVAAKVQNARVMRTRPIFRAWSCKFDLMFDPSEFNLDTVKEIWVEAGRRGLGDWRPKFGRFEVAFD